MVIEVPGYIEFEPRNVTRKHVSQSSWKCVAMIKTDCDLCEYYAWFLKKRFSLTLNKPLRGSHVTFISDKMDKGIFESYKRAFHKKPIKFYIELEPRSNGEHWWLRVHSPDAENVRLAMGLSSIPHHPFHLSLGYANEKNMAHSKYILEKCMEYELISNEPRKPLEKHQIVTF